MTSLRCLHLNPLMPGDNKKGHPYLNKLAAESCCQYGVFIYNFEQVFTGRGNVFLVFLGGKCPLEQ